MLSYGNNELILPYSSKVQNDISIKTYGCFKGSNFTAVRTTYVGAWVRECSSSTKAGDEVTRLMNCLSVPCHEEVVRYQIPPVDEGAM